MHIFVDGDRGDDRAPGTHDARIRTLSQASLRIAALPPDEPAHAILSGVFARDAPDTLTLSRDACVYAEEHPWRHVGDCNAIAVTKRPTHIHIANGIIDNTARAAAYWDDTPRDHFSSTIGVSVVVGSEARINIQDMCVSHHELGISVQGLGTQPCMPQLSNVEVLRCFGARRSSGIFLRGCRSPRLADVRVSHCGLGPGDTRPADYHELRENHGLYIQRERDVESGARLDRCLFAHNASHGAQIRCGGEIQDCVFDGNAIALLVAINSFVRGCDFRRPVNLSPTADRRWGVHCVSGRHSLRNCDFHADLNAVGSRYGASPWAWKIASAVDPHYAPWWPVTESPVVVVGNTAHSPPTPPGHTSVIL